ncbi:synaptonemal complex central element protein 2, partial [Megalops cyprinoides]|uniref:synaptonemal complex central element protein 2 n=1 Tax=Megalops cyprinoides TaxID=118141 RepID=UPI0018652C03
SDDSGIDTSRSDAESDVASDDPVHLPAISLRINEIGKKAQDLVEKINEHRAMDQEIMNTFQDKLTQKVAEVCQRVKEQMFSSYEGNSRVIESRLVELSAVLERSSQLISELQDASQTLAAINMGLRQLPEQ